MADLSAPLAAADVHNTFNTGTSWTDPASWEQKFGNAGKFIATSVLSGVNSFYNSAVTVGNWGGLGAKERPTDSWIRSIDSNWGAYYETNQELVDFTGFALGALIPGLGGAKLLNAGQNFIRGAIDTGKISGNLARATGLLVTKKANYIEEAAATIKGSLASQGVMNANTYKALASGFYQNTLEAAAGEILIAGTMFKSPVLEDNTVGDMIKGALLGGAIGGVFSAAGTIGTLRKATDKEDLFRLPWQKKPTFATKTDNTNRIITLADDLENTAIPTKSFVVEGAPDAQNLEAIAAANVTEKLYASKVDKVLNEIRTNFHGLSGTDTQLGNLVADISAPARDNIGRLVPGFAQKTFQDLSGAVDISRVSVTTAAEKRAAIAMKAGPLATEDQIAVRFIKLHGEDAGAVLDEMPRVLSLADTATSSEAVLRKVQAEGFTTKTMWDATKLLGQSAYLKAEARFIWSRNKRMLPSIPEGTQVHVSDIPLLERAYEDGQLGIKIISGNGPSLEVITPTSREELYKILVDSKMNTASNYLAENARLKGINPEDLADQAAKLVNVRKSYLQLEHSAVPEDDLFAHKFATKTYRKLKEERGLSTTLDPLDDPAFLPSYAKIAYSVDKNLAAQHESVSDAIVYYKMQQQIAVEGNKRVVAKHAGEFFDQLPDYTESELLKTNRRGAGATLLSGQNAPYGTPGAVSAQIGKVTSSWKQKAVKEVTEELNPSFVALGSKLEAALEYHSAERFVARSENLFVLHEDEFGRVGLLDRKVAEAVAKSNGELALDDLINETNYLELKLPETIAAVRTQINAVGKRTAARNEMWAAQGKKNERYTDVFRPSRPDPKSYPFFAFVKDPRVTNSNHTSMIFAASEKELAELIDRVPTHFDVIAEGGLANRIKVRTKLDVENYMKARQDYEYERTLHENYIDSELKSKGVYSNYFPKTDPQKIIDDVLRTHVRETETLVRDLVRLRYEPEFAFFEDMGKDYARYATSRFASKAEQIEQTTDNPYFNQIKTALNISNVAENHLIYGANKLLDEAVSKAYGAWKNTVTAVRSPEELAQVNAILDRQGMKPVNYDAALDALANHSAPKGVLTSFVRKANSMLSLFVLGLDPLNAVVNGVSSNILRMTELKSVLRAIENGNEELGGELAKLAKIDLPGVDSKILAPTKLVANALEALVKDGSKGPLKAKYKSWGLTTDRVEQMSLLIDDFTLKGTETVAELEAKTASGFARFKTAASELAQSGEKWTGNKFVEEANRFISANVMDQITSLAVKHGVMDERTAQVYINQFVNRVEGTILASQRPLIFQGPIGQSIGLFQRYQFNLLQQLFRYASEGSKKDVAMVTALQGTIFGLQGLPAFQAINTHIVGQLSGNPDHRDAYTFTYGALGETAANFAMYGMASNILQTNLYTRGDINPRHLTVLPTSLQETPLVAGWGKFLGSMYETFGKIKGGGNVWESILQGIEHNGISRPLAGFAQVFQAGGPEGKVYSTSNQGSILYSNDLMTWASITRMAGGRPLEEARANDHLWRFRTYEAARKSSMASLAETIKSTVIQGNEPSEAQIEGFAEKYVKLGGKQENFNRTMLRLYKNANVSQAEQLASKLKSPFSQDMQLLMGGDFPD